MWLLKNSDKTLHQRCLLLRWYWRTWAVTWCTRDALSWSNMKNEVCVCLFRVWRVLECSLSFRNSCREEHTVKVFWWWWLCVLRPCVCLFVIEVNWTAKRWVSACFYPSDSCRQKWGLLSSWRWRSRTNWRWRSTLTLDYGSCCFIDAHVKLVLLFPQNKTPLINENLKKCLNTKDGEWSINI